MKRHDKLIVLAGVIILVIASIGIYTWVPMKATGQTAAIDSFYAVSGQLNNTPSAIAVSDSNVFLPLIATPVCVHYDAGGNRTVLPLYIENLTNPSRAVLRAKNEQIKVPVDMILDDSKSAEQWSIDVARNYWTRSDAALIIEGTEEGYALGVLATPIASYLQIPVFVTAQNSSAIESALSALGVKRSIVCGPSAIGKGDVLRLTTVDDVVATVTKVLRNRFETIEYLVITNPQDAWPPEVLANVSFSYPAKTMVTSATTELIKTVGGMLSGADSLVGTFKIPEDYKYAVVKFKGINLNCENSVDLGDNSVFFVGANLPDEPSGIQQFEVYAGGTAMGGVPVRDANGNIIEDSTYCETVLYDRGGVEYSIVATPIWLASNSGQVTAEVRIEKLSDPVYPMIPRLSCLAPYLAAYHQGLIFGKPDFAFTADDDVLYLGEPSPGFYVPRRNPRLIDASNRHVYGIHEQVNALLANLSGINISTPRDIETLRDFYKDNPMYIALVGDATMLPQYIYESSIEPIDPVLVQYFWGGGIPSDFIYGNIDPNPYDYSNRAPDLYSDNDQGYPFQENVIGRITGWDTQDVSALLARTFFYETIVESLGDWKTKAAVMLGSGNDFQKPLARYKIFGEILGLVRHGEPMKLETGASYFNGMAITSNVEALGFMTEYIRENAATFKGYTDAAIDKLKTANVLNRLMMSKRQIRMELGAETVRGKEVQESSNFILANAHGNQHLFTMADVGVTCLGLGLPNGVLTRIFKQLASIIGYGPGYALSDLGTYSPRNVETMNLGPSFLWIESCICGKLDGMYPTQSITQCYLHSGCNVVVASTTTSNIPGGYLEPKRTMYDLPGQKLIRWISTWREVRQGNFPDQHFGFKIYSDTLTALNRGDVSIGFAYREARNKYLPEDADWLVWWSPPLVTTGIAGLDLTILEQMAEDGAASGLDPRLDNKYQSFFEYHVYGDPAFVPYIP